MARQSRKVLQRRTETMNSIYLRAVLLFSLLAISTATMANDLSWPDTQSGLKPGKSKTPQKAPLPPTPIAPPSPDVPSTIRGLSGRWRGWMCAKKACFAGVDVISLTPTGGRFNHVMAGPTIYDSFDQNFIADVINGNELVGRSRGLWVKIRLRPDGNLDILRWIDFSPKDMIYGVLSRVE